MKHFSRSLAVVAYLALSPAITFAEAITHPAIEINEAWAGPSINNVSAAFMEIANSTDHDQTLVSATSDLVESVELHDNIIEGETMRMRPIKQVVIPAGNSITFEPGQRHIMLIGFKKPVEGGEMIPLTLHFADGQTLDTSIPVKSMW